MLQLSGTTPDPDQGCVFTTLLVDQGRLAHWPRHRARLELSVQELYEMPLAADLDDRLSAACLRAQGRSRLRVSVSSDARTTLDLAAAGDPPAARRLVLVGGRTGPWHHKWCDRRQLEQAERLVGPGCTPLFVDADFRVLETTTGNLFAADDRLLITPPASEDLLPGVTRAVVLETAQQLGLTVQERPLSAADLAGRAAFTTSSIAGVVPVASLDGVDLPRDDVLVDRLRAAIRAG